MPDFLALTNSRDSIGHCLKREAAGVHDRKNRRHHEHHLTHSVSPMPFVA
jgi:hypothetical protein